MSEATLLPPTNRARLIEAILTRVQRRRASSFRRMSEAACREHIATILTALEQDLDADDTRGARTAANDLIEALADINLTFADLRSFMTAFRTELLAELDTSHHSAIEAWCFELVLVATMAFTVHQQAQVQAKVAAREVQRFESQLDELETALAEKTELLELVRRASTPVAPVAPGILVVPLVGIIDSVRAENLTETLLDEIASRRSRSAIIDVSGVPVFDTDAAQLLIRLARTVRLLGAEALLVGLSPGSAQTIVSLGIELRDLQTFATLQDGLVAALRMQQLDIVARPRRPKPR